MRDHEELVHRAALELSARLGEPSPEVFLTLGSGLAGLADRIEDAVDVPIAAIPGVPVSQVPGHPGTVRCGHLGGRPVLAQLGRAHLYEGHHPTDVVRMVDVAAMLGCSTYVVTCAAGGLVETFVPGELMIIADQLNLTGASPLVGRFADDAPLFVDMSRAYDPVLLDAASAVAEQRAIPVHTGVYAGLPGPAFETPAEVRMLKALGADAVGMSTVLEVLAARASQLRVLGVSTITNVHAHGTRTSHEEVLRVGAEAAERVAELVTGVLERPD